MPAPVPPTVVALLATEGVHRDLLGKPYLMGVFHAFYSPHFPAPLPQVAVYIALTGGHGTVRLTLRLVADGDDSAPLFTFEFPVEFTDPFAVREIAVNAPNTLTFPSAGTYHWQLLCGSEVIGERRLVVGRVGG